MFPLFETIARLRGEPLHLFWHQQRLNQSYQSLYGKAAPFLLDDIILSLDISYATETAYLAQQPERICFEYNETEYRITISSYTQKRFKTITPIELPHINYQLKYTDRTLFTQLMNEHPESDDLLILQNGFVTDTTIANIVFFDPNDDPEIPWVTPSTPLLKGTCRARLLAKESIKQRPIHNSELSRFQGFQLINAMRDFNPQQRLSMSIITPPPDSEKK